MDEKNPALRLLLNTVRLYPDERDELLQLLGRVARLEQVERDAQALVDAVLTEKVGTP